MIVSSPLISVHYFIKSKFIPEIVQNSPSCQRGLCLFLLEHFLSSRHPMSSGCSTWGPNSSILKALTSLVPTCLWRPHHHVPSSPASSLRPSSWGASPHFCTPFTVRSPASASDALPLSPPSPRGAGVVTHTQKGRSLLVT